MGTSSGHSPQGQGSQGQPSGWHCTGQVTGVRLEPHQFWSCLFFAQSHVGRMKPGSEWAQGSGHRWPKSVPIAYCACFPDRPPMESHLCRTVCGTCPPQGSGQPSRLCCPGGLQLDSFESTWGRTQAQDRADAHVLAPLRRFWVSVPISNVALVAL